MANVTDYRPVADRIAKQYGIPVWLFRNLISQESGWNPTIKSPAGAIGLTQLMPGTAQGLGVNPLNPVQNLAGGARYLADQYRKFGRWDLALSAYNSGPGGTESAGRVEGFPETQGYVRAILGGRKPTGGGPPTAAPVAGVMTPAASGGTDARRQFALQMGQAIMLKGRERELATVGAVLGLRQMLGSMTTARQNAGVMAQTMGALPPTATPPQDSGGMDQSFAKKVAMLIAAVKRQGGSLYISSGYRSAAEQKRLWDAAVVKYGSESAARKWVAPPGKSNHGRGIAADLGGDVELAHQLAPQFGLYFPMSWEPWHIEPKGSR